MQNDAIESMCTVQTEIEWSEFISLSGFSEPEVQEFVEFGLLTPASRNFPHSFAPASLTITQRAYRLRKDFELPPLALDLVFSLLTKIERMEQELNAIRNFPTGRTIE